MQQFSSKRVNLKYHQQNGSHLSGPPCVNSLCPSDAISWHRSGAALAQIMACYLTAPSHCLNQCWPLTKGVMFAWEHFNQNWSKYQFEKFVWKLHFWNYFHISQRAMSYIGPASTNIYPCLSPPYGLIINYFIFFDLCAHFNVLCWLSITYHMLW